MRIEYPRQTSKEPNLQAACNGAHSVKQRLARWLLTMRDRHDENTLPITQDLLAEMLGVHRLTVTNAVRALHRAKLIQADRKRLVILDRGGLIKAHVMLSGGSIAHRPAPAEDLSGLTPQEGLRPGGSR